MFKYKWWSIALSLVAIGVIAFASVAGVRKVIQPVEGWNVRVERKILESQNKWPVLISRLGMTNELYHEVFTSIVLGVMTYRTRNNSQVLYPGIPGTRGVVVEGLEGFARTGVLIAAWIDSGRDQILHIPGHEPIDLMAHLSSGLREGVDPSSPGYWGRITHLDQRTVEAADIALIAWMLRDTIRSTFTPIEKKHLIDWLESVGGKELHGGNWHLFPLMIYRAIEIIDPSKKKMFDDLSKKHWSVIERSYVGDGWYSDGPQGKIDLYNAWQIHYLVYWLHRMEAPVLEGTDALNRLNRFADSYQYLMSTTGFPIFGRSLCYRMAVAAPLVASSLLIDSTVSATTARRAMDVSLQYFLSNGALQDGVMTQGYCGQDTRWLENYSGRASCFWGLRALVLMFHQSEDARIWTVAPGKLPIELRDYTRELANGKIKVIGSSATSVVKIVREENTRLDRPTYIDYVPKPLLFLGEHILQRPLRAPNFEEKYNKEFYASDAPFCGCQTQRSRE